MTQARRLHVTVVGDGRGIESALDACVVVPASEVNEDRTADCVILLSPTLPDIAAARRLASSGAPTAVLIDDAAASRNQDLAGLGFRDVRYATVASLPTILAQIAAANTSGRLRAIVRAADSGTQFEVVVASGSVRQDDLICEARDGLEARVESVVDLGEGSVRIQLDRAIRCDVGDLLCHPSERPEVADQFSARLTWHDGHPLIAGRSYRFVVGEKIVAGSVTTIKHRIEPDMAGPLAARTLQRGETGSVNISLRRPVAFDLSEGSGQLRRLRVLDAVNDLKLGTGTLSFALRRASNIHWQSVTVSKTQRAAIKQQKPVLVWFTGLSGSGKSTIANLLESRLLAEGCHTYLLDGDNVRHGLNRDLGFTDADRVENIRRVGEIAKLMVDAGLIVLASFISPFEAERALARELLGEGEFVEVFVDAPLAVAEERDPKGLYRRARRGELRNFTGIDSPYERPGNPEIRLDTATTPAEALAQQVFDYLAKRGHLAL